MSNTPPVRHGDLGRGGRSVTSYLYPATPGLDYSSHLHGTEQPIGMGSFRQAIDQATDGRGGSFRQDPVPPGRVAARVRVPEENVSYRMHNETVKTRDGNPGLVDAEYKSRENVAEFNTVFRNGDYDSLRSINNCPPESGLRNFNTKSKEQQTFPDIAYGRLQQHQGSLDPRLSNLQFLPTSSMFPQQIGTPPFNRQYGYDMLPFLPYPLRDVPAYGMDRRNNLQQSYPQTVPGASFASYADFTKSEIDRNTFPKHPSRYSSPLEVTKTVNEGDPFGSSRRTPRQDGFSPYLNTYPRSASTLPEIGRKYQSIGENIRGGSFPSNGVKQNGPPTVDLTLSTSPSTTQNEDLRNEPPPRDRSGQSIVHQQREPPKENGSHHQGDMAKERGYSRNIQHKKTNPVSQSHYPTSSLSPFAGLLPFPPSLNSYTTMNSGLYSSYNNSLADSAKPHSLSKGLDHNAIKPVTSQWPVAQRYHTPSPHRYGSLEATKKNSSPSLQLKTKPMLVSDLTFNYPEGSGSKSETKSQPAVNYTDRPINAAKTQLWPKKDDSKLSPLENEVMDLARDGKPPNLSKFEGLAHTHTRIAPSHVMPPKHFFHGSRSVRQSDYPPSKHFPSLSAMPHGNPSEQAKNSVSVIQSTPKSLQNDERLEKLTECGVRELLKQAVPFNQEPEQMLAGKESMLNQGIGNCAKFHTAGIDAKEVSRPVGNAEGPLKPGRKRKPSKSKDLEQRPKRKYTKRSDIWRKKGLHLQQQEVRPQLKENKKKERGEEPIEPSIPEKLDVKESDRIKPGPEMTIQQSESPTVSQRSESFPPEKMARPQRKSQGLGIDEYLYGWFSEEDTENDDSSDEDYSCPTKVNKARACKGLSNLRQTRRMPSRQSSDGVRTRGLSSDSDDYSVQQSFKQSKRGRRRMEARKEEEVIKKVTSEHKCEDDEVEDATKEGDDIKDSREEYPELVNNEDNKKGALEQQKQTGELTDIQSSTSDKTEVVLPKPGLESVDSVEASKIEESKQPEVEETQKEPVRKKRKYTKRAEKVSKSAEVIPRKKRKYTKTSEKWFRNKTSKTPNENSKKQNNEMPSQIPNIPPTICPLLAELYTNGQHGSSEPGDKENPTSSDPGSMVHKYACSRTSPHQFTMLNVASPSQAVPTTANVGDGDKCSVPTDEKETTKTDEKKENDNIAEAPIELGQAKDSHVPVKIPKKRGRKPGWRKHLQVPKDGSTATQTLPPVKKKYKKPKGDGLPRFGMRKKYRRSKPKLPTLPNTIQTSTRSQDAAKQQDTAKQQPGQARQKRKYNVASRREKRRQYLIRIGRISAQEIPSTSTATTSLIKTNAHKISEELQSQENDYDFKSLSFYNESDGEEIDEDSSMLQSTQDGSIEQPSSSQSQPQTPTDGTMSSQQSPFPSHLKKLCCNTAIGETQLHKAARIGYTENLQYYLETGINANSSDNAGYTALHEACMRNNLEAASLLLQFGADVNKHAVDGTRPLHDAVEYDHLEMVRLMLACGADPLLSKFSGRSIPNMIIKRSQRMKQFINAYLEELKDFKDSDKQTEDLEWKFPCSAVFDDVKSHQFSTLDYPPDQEELFVEFEMFDKAPCSTYLLQTDEDSERGNYFTLDDYLGVIGKSQGRPSDAIRVLSMPVESFRKQINENLVQRIQFAINNSKPDLSSEFIEVVAAEDSLIDLCGAEVVKIPLLDKNEQSTPNCTETICETTAQNGKKGVCNTEDKIDDLGKLPLTEPEKCSETPATDGPNSVLQIESTKAITEGPASEMKVKTRCTRALDSKNSTLENNQDVPSCQKEVSHRNGWNNSPDLNNTGTVDEVR